MYRIILAIALISLLCLPMLAQEAAQSDQPEVTVVVTAERALQPVSESISSATVITAKQIKDLGAQSVADVLKSASGVTITQNGQMGSLAVAHVRGTSLSQTLVLVDGQRVTSAAFGGTADLSKIPVTDIARIEVIRGPVSSLYGSDAIGGVINIITKTPARRAYEAKLGYGDSTQTRYMMLSGANDRSAWQITSDFPSFFGSRENSNYSATNVAGKLSFTTANGWDIALRGEDYHDTLGLPGATYWLSPNDQQWWDRSSFDVTAKRNVGAGQLELHAYDVKQVLRELNPDAFTDSDIIGKTRATEVVYRFGSGNLNWTVGGEYRTESYRDIEMGSVQADTDITNTALFVQNRIALNEATDLLAGARMDDHSVAGNKVTPRIGINRALNEKTRVRASYAEGFRAPSLVDLYYNNFGTIGNPNLKPEKSRQYEVGINTCIGRDTLDLALFSNRVADQIIWQAAPTEENPWAGTFENVDRARQQGLELTWDHPISDSVRLNVFYNYIDAMNLTNGRRIYGIPYNQLGATLSTRADSWNVALTGRCTSNRLYSTGTVAGRAIFDLTLTRQSDKPTNPYAIVRNLLNTEYEEVAGYPAEGLSFEIGARSTW